MLRRLIETAGDIQEMAYAAEDDVDETLDRAESLIFEVAERRVADTLMPLHPALEQTLIQLEALYDRDSDIIGVAHRLPRSRRAAARAAAVDAHRSSRPAPARERRRSRSGMAQHVALRRRASRCCSSRWRWATSSSRSVCSRPRRRSTPRKLPTGQLSEHEWPTLNQAVGRLAEAPFFIDDNPHCTVMEMRAKARRIKARYGDLGLDRRRLPPADVDAGPRPRAARSRCRSCRAA